MADKPKFNPKEAFQSITSKPKFNPKEPFVSMGHPGDVGEDPGEVKATTSGFWTGVPFAKQLGAAGKTAMDVASGVTPPSGALDEYRGQRDTLSQDMSQAKAAHPNYALAGGIAGNIATPGAGSSLEGAMGYGAGEGLSESQADLTKPSVDNLGQAAQDTTWGSAAGGAGYGVGQLVGAGVQKAGASLGTLARKAARLSPHEAEAYVKNPQEVSRMAEMLDNGGQPQLQDQAVEAINQSRKALREQGAANSKELAAVLEPHRVGVNLDELKGFSPEIDSILERNIGRDAQTPIQSFQELANPSAPSLPANEANEIKRLLQESAKYKKGTVLDPNQAARNEAAGKKASELRKLLEDAGGDRVSELNKSTQEGINLQSELRKGLRAPLSFVTTGSPDRLANLSRAEQRGAGGILDFGNKLGAAKTMSTKDIDDALIREAEKTGGRAALRFGNFAGPTLQSAIPQGAQSAATMEGMAKLPSDQTNRISQAMSQTYGTNWVEMFTKRPELVQSIANPQVRQAVNQILQSNRSSGAGTQSGGVPKPEPKKENQGLPGPDAKSQMPMDWEQARENYRRRN